MSNYTYFAQTYHDGGRIMSSASWRIPQNEEKNITLEPAYRISIRCGNGNKNAIGHLLPKDVLYLKEIIPPLAAQHIIRPLRRRPPVSQEAPQYTSPMRTTAFKGLSIATLLEIGLKKAEFEMLDEITKDNLNLKSEDKYVLDGIRSILDCYRQNDYSEIKSIRIKCADVDGIRKIFSSQLTTSAANRANELYGKIEVFYCEDAENPFLLRICENPSVGSYSDPRFAHSPMSNCYSIQEFLELIIAMYYDMEQR